MDLKTAQSLYEEYKLIYEEKDAVNCKNEETYFLNSLEVIHLEPFDDTSYDVILNTIKYGKLIVFKLEVAIGLFGNPL